jgi:hypothetical protein
MEILGKHDIGKGIWSELENIMPKVNIGGIDVAQQWNVGMTWCAKYSIFNNTIR